MWALHWFFTGTTVLITTCTIVGAGAEDGTLSDIRRVNRTNLNNEQAAACVTIEFKLSARSGQGNFDERRYRLLRKLILDRLNRQQSTTTVSSETITGTAEVTASVSQETYETTAEPTIADATTEGPTKETSTVDDFIPPTPDKRRRRRQSGNSPPIKYTEENIKFIDLQPNELGNIARISILLDKTGNLTIDQEQLWAIVREIEAENDVFENVIGLPSEQVYKGLPPELTDASSTYWWIIFPLLIIIICIIIIIFYCCRKQRQVNGQTKPLKVTNSDASGCCALTPSSRIPSGSINPEDDGSGEGGLICRYADMCQLQLSNDKTVPNNSTPM